MQLPLTIITTASLLLAATAPHSQDDMGWTGVLDEDAFAALHDLKEGEAPELRGEDIEVAGMDAYLSRPAHGEPLGAVIVIHEWWGLNDHVRHWSDRLASDGYVALAIDLYGGTVATTREEAMAATRSVDADEALAKLVGAHEYLVSSDGLNMKRTACIGWCFGGGWSLKLAMAEPELDAAVMYYGRLVDDPEALESIEASMLGVFGNQDSSIPPAAVEKFAAAMKAAGRDLTLRQYDANHAFANPSSARYDAANAAAAWLETRTFLCEQLFPEARPGVLAGGGRELETYAPEGWSLGRGSAMRLATFDAPGEVECSVVSLMGDGGGVPANFNRWRAQLGQKELDDDEINALPRIPMFGQLAPSMRVTGRYTGMGDASIEDGALLGAIAVLDEETIFVKMTGPREAVDAQAEQFAAFCRGLR